MMTTFDYVLWGLIALCFVLMFVGDILDKKGLSSGVSWILLSAILGEFGWISWLVHYRYEGSWLFAAMMCG